MGWGLLLATASTFALQAPRLPGRIMNRRLFASLLLCSACVTAPPAKREERIPSGIDASILDHGTSPCSDFYQFACGGWLAQATIPPERSTWSRSFSNVQERNQGVLRGALEDYAAGKHLDEVPEAQKLGDLYGACMDEAAIEARALKPLQGELARLAVTDAASLEQAVAHLQSQGVRALFTVGREQDPRDATRALLTLSSGGLGLPDRELFLREDPRAVQLREALRVHVAKLLALSGIDASQAATGALNVVRIDRALAEASLSRVDRRDPLKTFHRFEIERLATLTPHLHWGAFLADVGHSELRTVNVKEPSYFARLDELIRTTPPADWNLYLRWRVLDAAAELLPAPFAEEQRAFLSLTTGVAAPEPRWRHCVAEVDALAGEPLGRAFMARAFPEASKRAAEAMAQELAVALAVEVESVGWLDQAARQRVHQKLANLRTQMGSGVPVQDLQTLAVTRDEAVRNRFNGRAAEFERTFSGGPVAEREASELSASRVNGLYLEHENALVFLAGILQPPLFSPQAEPAANLGAIGTLMGHELTHAFDDETHGPAFTRGAACVARQFDGYVAVDDLHVDGEMTLGENLADLGGVKLALTALQASEARAPSARAAFSAEQTFFIAQAQLWCRRDRAPYQRVLVAADPHAPSHFRVNGPLSNLEAFARAWQCPAGSPMVRAPEQRCEVW
jgi:putative endopeptidase